MWVWEWVCELGAGVRVDVGECGVKGHFRNHVQHMKREFSQSMHR